MPATTVTLETALIFLMQGNHFKVSLPGISNGAKNKTMKLAVRAVVELGDHLFYPTICCLVPAIGGPDSQQSCLAC